MFNTRYPVRKGSAWLRNVAPEDRKVFGTLGYTACVEQDININSIGGKARASTASRAANGRFITKETQQCHKEQA